MQISYACVVLLLFYSQHVRKIPSGIRKDLLAFLSSCNNRQTDLQGSKHISQAFIRSLSFLTNHTIFGDCSANFKCVSVFHIRKDIRSGIRAALGYSPKCKSSILNLRNIFLISQNFVNGRENA